MTTLGCLPDPWSLPESYCRHHPTPDEQRAAVLELAQVRDWAGLDWPELIEALLALGRTDIPLARLTEGHIDALRIFAEAGVDPVPGACYGVWASRSHGTGLQAVPAGRGWCLTGTLRFASGAGVLDRALIPVWPDETTHVLLDVPVADWVFETDGWRARAMELSRSHTITLAGSDVAARQVGDLDFYLGRWGFLPGGIGVAAVWAGGCARVADVVAAAVPAARRSPAQLVRWGRVRTDLAVAAALCRTAPGALAGTEAEDAGIVATEVRAGVAAAARRVLDEARTVAGPAGMAFAEDVIRAVDDLALYVAQQNADADASRLGALS